MIRFVEQFQALQCTVCGYWIELDKRTLRDPDKLIERMDLEKQKHKDCKPKRS
jgi:hypothetical protein